MEPASIVFRLFIQEILKIFLKLSSDSSSGVHAIYFSHVVVEYASAF
jgi:hypothetical protein